MKDRYTDMDIEQAQKALQKCTDDVHNIIDEIQEENRALHSEVSRLIDEVGKCDVYINELRMDVQQTDEKLDRSREHVQRLQGINKDFSRRLDVADNAFNDLLDLVSGFLVLEFDEVNETYLPPFTSDGDEAEGLNVFCEKLNKIIFNSYDEVKDND